MKKPIKVFWSELSNRFYASSNYVIDGGLVKIVGAKTDVTDDIGAAVIKYDIIFEKIEEKE